MHAQSNGGWPGGWLGGWLAGWRRPAGRSPPPPPGWRSSFITEFCATLDGDCKIGMACYVACPRSYVPFRRRATTFPLKLFNPFKGGSLKVAHNVHCKWGAGTM